MRLPLSAAVTMSIRSGCYAPFSRALQANKHQHSARVACYLYLASQTATTTTRTASTTPILMPRVMPFAASFPGSSPGSHPWAFRSSCLGFQPIAALIYTRWEQRWFKRREICCRCG